jgi:alkyl hydroperoxide reductase subunit AhpC
MSIQVQQDAPNFSGDAVIDGEFKNISLSDYKGKWVVLFFYPLDFTFVCPTEITAFSDAIDKFRAMNTEVIACSVDSKFSHLAWINTPRKHGGLGDIDIPLLADISKNISRDYGVLLEDAGVALRGLFIISPEGKLVYQVVHDLNVGRSTAEVLRVLHAFQKSAATGAVCPADWDEGADTMQGDPEGSKAWFEKHG